MIKKIDAIVESKCGKMAIKMPIKISIIPAIILHLWL